MVGGAVLREFHFGSAEQVFLIDYGTAVFALSGSVLAALAGPALFFSGLESRVTSIVLMHGGARGAVIAAQAIAVAIVLGWLAVLCGGASAGLFSLLGHAAATGTALRALAMELAPLLVTAAMSLFFATISRTPLLAAVLTLAAALAGRLAPVIAFAAAKATGAAKGAWLLLGWLVPDLAIGESAALTSALGYLAAYAALYIFLAGWCFSRRDL
ncbi:MAG: hypothetical protein KF715_01890 [Candidatus Didemnitutus sp.]|nr:hypothetical protein [Candidatus Didemnitutus sp.]